jgi:hypothetical protein
MQGEAEAGEDTAGQSELESRNRRRVREQNGREDDKIQTGSRCRVRRKLWRILLLKLHLSTGVRIGYIIYSANVVFCVYVCV